MKVLCTFSFLLFCFLLSAQEICDNGIDDDGDSLIDLLDDDCSCSEPASITADFENNTCCPEGFTILSPFGGPPTGGYTCVSENWDFAGFTSVDYFNTCGYLGGNLVLTSSQTGGSPVFFPEPPQPFPSGEGVMGMLLTADFPSPEYTEGIERCLDCKLIAGQTYDVTFFVGFNSTDTVYTSEPVVEFALYGKPACVEIPDQGFRCLEDYGWIEMATFTAEGNEGEWVSVSGTFTAPFEVGALAFSKSCEYITNFAPFVEFNDYHFIDDLQITGSFTGDTCEPEINTNLTWSCDDGYVLNAVPEDAVEYQWYLNGIAITGANTNPWPIDPVVVGEYQVRATFPSGRCAISEPIDFVPEFDELNLDADLMDPLCFAENTGSIALQINSSDGPFDIQWDTGGTESLLENLSAGTYSVTVTDANGCSASAEFTLSDPPPLSVELNIQQPAGFTAGTAAAIPTGGVPPYQYNWSNDAVGPIVTDLTPGSYSVVVTDSNGCATIATFDILEVLQAEIVVTPEICAADCNGVIEVLASGGLEPYTYLWDIPGESNVQQDLCAGVYQFTVTDGFGTSYTQEVLVETEVTISLSIEATEVRCATSDLTGLDLSIAGGQSPYGIAWSTGATTEDLENVGVGAFSVTVTDGNGCVGVQDYNVEPYAPQLIDFTTRPTNCRWDEFELSLLTPFSPELTYFINGAAVDLGPSGILGGLTPGNYRFSYEDTNGCTEEIGAFNLQAGPPYTLFVDESIRTLEYGEEVELEILVSPESQLLSGSEITWSTLKPFDCLAFIGGECTQIQFNATESEFVQVRFRDENGCEQVFTIPIRVEIPDYVYIPNVFSPNGDGVNDVFTIYVTDFVRVIKSVQLFNRWGALVYENNDVPTGRQQFWDGRFQGQLTEPGVFVYLISLELVTGEEVLLSGDVTVVR
ncbi:MAG: gliding motility-associated C-terminal domain-containing protein [Bacteroidota bacterium]